LGGNRTGTRHARAILGVLERGADRDAGPQHVVEEDLGDVELGRRGVSGLFPGWDDSRTDHITHGGSGDVVTVGDLVEKPTAAL
jgi:hypothetical protein